MIPNICEIRPNKINSNMNSKFFLFYGEQGTWKTTVASQFPDALLIGGEIGYQFIDGIRAVPVTNWSDIKDLYRQLQKPAAKEMYKTLVFDTISNIYQMCYNYVLGQLGVSDPGEVGYGKGWRSIRDEFNLIKNFSKLGYGMVFIAHAKENEVVDAKTKTSTIQVKSDLDKMPSNLINELVDFTFYVRKEFNEETGKEEVYAYSSLPNIETKSRLKTFPNRILFDYNILVAALNKAIVDLGKDTDNSNLREVEETPWTYYRDEVINLVKNLSETSAAEEMSRYITEMFEIRLSETTELHKDKLIAARDYLIGLSDKIA